MRWTAIGLGQFCPTLVSPKDGTTVLFTRSASAELLCQEWNGSAWESIRTLGIPVARSRSGAPAVPVGWQVAGCRGPSGSIELFSSSPDGDLLHMSGVPSPGRTAVFECVGALAQVTGDIAIPFGVATSPAVCLSTPERLDVFAVGPEGHLLHTTKTADEWSGFESLGPVKSGATPSDLCAAAVDPVAACSCGNSAIAVFARGPNGDLLLKWWDGATWSEYTSLGFPETPDPAYPAVMLPAPLTGPPAACTWGPNRIDVFARGSRGDILHMVWNGTAWSAFESLGMPVADEEVVPLFGAITACTSGPETLHVVVRGVDGRLYHTYWDGSWEHAAGR